MCRRDALLTGYPLVEVSPKHIAMGQTWPGGFGTALVSLPSCSSCPPFLSLFSLAAFGLLPVPPIHPSSWWLLPTAHLCSVLILVCICSAQRVWLPCDPQHFSSSSSPCPAHPVVPALLLLHLCPHTWAPSLQAAYDRSKS